MKSQKIRPFLMRRQSRKREKRRTTSRRAHVEDDDEEEEKEEKDHHHHDDDDDEQKKGLPLLHARSEHHPTRGDEIEERLARTPARAAQDLNDEEDGGEEDLEEEDLEGVATTTTTNIDFFYADVGWIHQNISYSRGGGKGGGGKMASSVLAK